MTLHQGLKDSSEITCTVYQYVKGVDCFKDVYKMIILVLLYIAGVHVIALLYVNFWNKNIFRLVHRTSTTVFVFGIQILSILTKKFYL